MSDNSKIEWTNSTWSPVTGCTRVSSGCDHCYSSRMTFRLEMMGQKKYTGLTVLNPKGDRHFNGVVKCHDDVLTVPMGWKKPRKIFVNSMSDSFHKEVPFEFIDKIHAIAALCPQHTMQILTKRPERMAEYYLQENKHLRHSVSMAMRCFNPDWDGEVAGPDTGRHWPLSNVWNGTSAENQETFDERWPHLKKVPTAVRWLSLEPVLGPIILPPDALWANGGVQFVVVGGESGPGARPINPKWVRDLRDQCVAAGIPFFFKQWGEWIGGEYDSRKGKFVSTAPHDVIFWTNPGHPPMHQFEAKDEFPWWFYAAARVGKKSAGRLLDGRTWDQFPQPTAKTA